jgi:hypothetical protein
MSAKTIFVMLYAGAIEGSGRFIRPDQVTKMSDSQAKVGDAVKRLDWARKSLVPGSLQNIRGRWYAANTREPIRDETLRLGLIALGAVVERTDIPTTSAKPRYALASHFVRVLSEAVARPKFANRLIAQWQVEHLSPTALTRIDLIRRGAIHLHSSQRITVRFPNGETRLMRPGPSTLISKAVIEQFTPKFLLEPGVIFLSESGEKVVQRDDELARRIRLNLDYAKNLPDIILTDVHQGEPKLVFVEVVATNGVINEQRKRALLDSARGYDPAHIYFISAFLDRSTAAFRKLVSEIAWGTFAWFASEPLQLVKFGSMDDAP